MARRPYDVLTAVAQQMQPMYGQTLKYPHSIYILYCLSLGLLACLAVIGHIGLV